MGVFAKAQYVTISGKKNLHILQNYTLRQQGVWENSVIGRPLNTYQLSKQGTNKISHNPSKNNSTTE